MRKTEPAGRLPALAEMASRLLQIRRIKAPGAWARWAGTLACLGALTVGMPRAAAKQKPLPTKTISGLVLDASGRGISGASVLLTDLATRKTQAIYSGTNGGYNFSGLIPYDDYKVLARYHGMESRARRVSSADPRTAIVVDLTVGASKPNS